MSVGKSGAALCGRREFVLGAVGAGMLASGGVSATASELPVREVESPVLRFGLLTDSHYAQKDTWPKSGSGQRHYRDSVSKMREAVTAFNRGKADFAIELGDMKDMGVPEASKEIRLETLGFLDEIENAFAQFEGPRYHVLGNHDMDSISKEDFLSHTANHGAAKGKSNYSFEMKGFKFIVLDGCFRADRKPYCCGNFNWTKAFFPDVELDWLDAELAGGPPGGRPLPAVGRDHRARRNWGGVRVASAKFTAEPSDDWKQLEQLVKTTLREVRGLTRPRIYPSMFARILI